MRINGFYIAIFLVFSCVYNSLGQKKKGTTNNKSTVNINSSFEKNRNVRKVQIKLMTSSDSSGIQLRWGVADAYVWTLCNKYGFNIERYTISRNSKMLPVMEKVKLTATSLKPKPLNSWETITKHDDYAAIMAQALYGDGFEMNINTKDTKSPSLANIFNRTTELQQRFGAFYFSADLSFKASCMGACGYIDTTAIDNEKYLYRVYANIPSKLAITDTALSVISKDEKNEFPRISNLGAIFGNKIVTIGWSGIYPNNAYSAFYIEKLKEGDIEFKRANKYPISAFQSSQKGSKSNSGLLYYTDTLEQNDVKYSYRIVGVTPFSRLGSYSDTVSGFGSEILSYTPNISSVDIDDEGNALISWEFDNDGEKLIKGFQLEYSVHVDSSCKKVMEINSVSDRKLKYQIKDNSGYYTIAAIPINNTNMRRSFPYLVQPEDSTAPAAPLGLKGWIDSTGLTIISWKPNLEKDFYGYKLLKKYALENEYSLVSDSIIRDTVFFDFVNNKMLNKKVYYELRALDKRFNTSTGTEITIKKPDIIPPTAPVFANFLVKQDIVSFSWINSRDEDIVKTCLLRKNLSVNQTTWDTVYSYTKDTAKFEHFNDTSVMPSNAYNYALVAYDDSYNHSGIDNILKIITLPAKAAELFNNFKANVDREDKKITLKWVTNPSKKKITEIQLYKAEGNNKISLYKVLNPNESSFVDKDLIINTKYRYAIRGVFEVGMPSEFLFIEIIY